MINIAAIALAVTTILVHTFAKMSLVIGIYGILIIGYILFKLIFAELFFYRQKLQKRRDVGNDCCDIGIAFYNEDPNLLVASIQSILNQQKIRIGKVVVVDDGSHTTTARDKLHRTFSSDERILIIRSDINLGKRHALGMAFEKFTSAHAALIDSDTILAPDALSNMLARLTPDIEVVTANIRALNAGENLLTRLIDTRYRNAFMVERAAQSVFHSVLCASGVLSIYRTDFLRAVKEEWVCQTFLGKPVQFGDDRRLSTLALRSGGIVIALDAIAYTHVPTQLWQFFKQQLRWNKSFIRESILTIRDFGVLKWPGLLSFLEIFFWFFYLINIISSIFFDYRISLITLSWIWLAYIMTSGIFRNITLILRQPRLILFVPLTSVLHVIILTPLRLLALITILDTRWGTR